MIGRICSEMILHESVRLYHTLIRFLCVQGLTPGINRLLSSVPALQGT